MTATTPPPATIGAPPATAHRVHGAAKQTATPFGQLMQAATSLPPSDLPGAALEEAAEPPETKDVAPDENPPEIPLLLATPLQVPMPPAEPTLAMAGVAPADAEPSAQPAPPTEPGDLSPGLTASPLVATATNLTPEARSSGPAAELARGASLAPTAAAASQMESGADADTGGRSSPQPPATAKATLPSSETQGTALPPQSFPAVTPPAPAHQMPGDAGVDLRGQPAQSLPTSTAPTLADGAIHVEIGGTDKLDIRIDTADRPTADKVSSELEQLQRDLAEIGSEVEVIRVEVRSERSPNTAEAQFSSRQAVGDGRMGDGMHGHGRRPEADAWNSGQQAHRQDRGAGQQERQGQMMTNGIHVHPRRAATNKVDRYA